ncbi:succinylglutamate desuccinylase/aspartoacylase family protein [Bremerella alba]|uniref:N-alpha-acetyl-L-2,4-diaminobutyric acid deacetylase n=1 Tax=Bremerella alba TaxID=980252 RepID=A0A7V8V9W9_9BACT|nr:succinylglutamate desuccinylase/aspartoacylase family protein [Bremerella alba]MBA2117659.1 N-alpha-acetyl-L-2,4-diaminobutyric acid deacetylase [Bremerella alba]
MPSVDEGLNQMTVPRITIQGNQDGPTLLIIAGIHGDEYESIEAVHRLAEMVDQSALVGKVVLVPIANRPAFSRQSRIGDDALDLARTFPGHAEGTSTQQIAFELTRLIEEADFLIDLHTGGQALEIAPLVGYMLVADQTVLDRQRRMAQAFGLPIIWGTTPQLEGRSLSAARDAGVTAIYAEWGGGGGCQQAGVEAYIAGCLRVLAAIEMLPGHVESQEERPFVVEDDREQSGHLQRNYPSPHAGLYRALIDLQASVLPGDELGYLLDVDTLQKTVIRSSQSGQLITRRILPAVNPGDCLAVILENAELQ